MLADSHCHLDMLDLDSFEGGVEGVLKNAGNEGVDRFLCVAVNRADFPAMLDLAERYENVWFSAGIHPNEQEEDEISVEELVAMADRAKVVAVGETGLDYYRSSGDLDWQRDRFHRHIDAAKQCGKPLIIHSRDAKEDTIKILSEEGARDVGGVMHCFTGDWDMAQRAMELDFCISFSGIVTFKSAKELQEVAQKMPLDKMLVETDCPYLAPVPHRGKPNQPAYVRHVAEFIAELRDEPFEQIAETTTENFCRLFKIA